MKISLICLMVLIGCLAAASGRPRKRPSAVTQTGERPETGASRPMCVTKKCGNSSSGTRSCNLGNAFTATNIQLLRDYSGKCQLGETFGIIEGSAWTSSGCEGKFWICFDHKGEINPAGPVTEPTTVPETTTTTPLTTPTTTETTTTTTMPTTTTTPTTTISTTQMSTTQRPTTLDFTPFDYSDPDDIFYGR